MLYYALCAVMLCDALLFAMLCYARCSAMLNTTACSMLRHALYSMLCHAQCSTILNTTACSMLRHPLCSALLAASIFCMQCLSAPTRKNIYRAHSQHRWLDIGVPSIRNLRDISAWRFCLWWLFALSNIPLHLLYNSTIIASKAAQKYNLYVASSALLDGSGRNWSA